MWVWTLGRKDRHYFLLQLRFTTVKLQLRCLLFGQFFFKLLPLRKVRPLGALQSTVSDLQGTLYHMWGALRHEPNKKGISCESWNKNIVEKIFCNWFDFSFYHWIVGVYKFCFKILLFIWYREFIRYLIV